MINLHQEKVNKIKNQFLKKAKKMKEPHLS
jgi:hypothetical protein